MANDNIIDFGAYEEIRKSKTASGGGGNGNDIERRLCAVEGKLEIVAADVGGLRKDTACLVENMAEIKGRLASVPSALQWLGIIIGLIFTIMGLSFALLRFGLPH